MKQFIYASILIFLASCGTDKPKDKSAELADLKKQQLEINKKIAELETQVGKKDSARTVDVSAVAVQPTSFTSYIEVQGAIDADENVSANPEAPGIITAVYAVAGQQVKKGQLIARLDNRALEQQILQARSSLELSNTLYQRQKNLWDQKIGTEVQFLQAKTSRDIAQKSLDALNAQASMYRIVAPISGTLDKMDLKVGMAVQPGTPGAQIVNLSKLKVKASVAETYAGKVSKGDNVLVAIPDASDSVKTTVSFISKVIDPASRSFIVEVKLPARNNLKPNMTAVLNIVDYAKKNALVVPVKAILRSEKGEYVFISENGKAKRVNVSVGNNYRGQVEIVSGLKAGDKVITDGNQDVEEGDILKTGGI
ncbi:efflux RND transporter periplasmic adaptor subunit [Hufsiella ginkgonis]|uniref:Efflux RND transporter periplasmic adaptor subunit n=1 Tax=Hufsiella ginkgonis TaxID=2695274 RepID=A0A7K1XWT6_9SPHI|nr:efflux RND transporter periplasmic adaptor subunit [Hufsiella ginkgonis]MXV15462.1 efflux RND transporter periplasmic adaptor subunit [Hufsiella ginkgonis]